MSFDTDIRYFPETDTMAIAVRGWPGTNAQNRDKIGGEDAGEDLVIHYAADGAPWMWEIEHASKHPEHIAAALDELRRLSTRAAE
jgi:uncharacterized protein YuzE